MWRTRIGDIEVIRVEEMLRPGFDPAFLYPAYDPAILADHPILARPELFDHASGRLMSSMQSWLVRSGREVILIDTGCGNGKVREEAAFRRFHMLDLPYLENLTAAGVRPEDVTMVINTHLHVDHVGWNTRLVDGQWVPAFPHARYVMGRAEFAHWHDPKGGPAIHPEGVPCIVDSVDPVVEAGLAEFVEAGETVAPGISLEAVPGHTPHQLAVRIGRPGEDGLFTADVFHQPMQIYRPDWNSRYCELPEVAVATRLRVFAEAADGNTVLFPSHTGYPHAGRVGREGTGFTFIPLSV